MIYEIYTENGTKKKRALTGNGYGLPLGTWISYEGTCPDGFIEAGQSYNTSVYSALYAMLGSNTVPERFDHDRPSEWEEVVSTNTFTPNYDGVMIVGVNNTNLIVKVNDVEITRVETGQITDTSIPLKKGDVVTFFNLGGSAISKSFKVSYYKKHLAIKATPAYVEPDTVSDMVNTLRTQDSYSTSEVNTGKKWIDGKPIYRKVIHWDTPQYNMGTINGVSTASVGLPSMENVIYFDVLLEGGGYKMNLSTNTSVRTMGFNDDFTTFYATTGGTLMNIKDIIIEYTKTTD
jgi:hypothetical protein